MKKDKPLDARAKKYCRERIKGKTQRQAHKAAGYGPNESDKTHDEEACKLEKDERIKAELARLTRLAEEGAVMDRQQRISLLSEMAMDDTRKDDSRQRALDMLNKMHGDYSEKVVTEVSGSLDISYEDKRQMILDALKSNE